MPVNPPDKSQKPESLRFDESQSEQVAVVADKSWWDKERYRVGGLLRVVSRGATMASGMGIATDKSPWRVVGGGMGLLSGAFITAFGKKENGVTATQKTSEETAFKHTGRIYHGLVALAGAAAIVSGKKSNRPIEVLSGIWTLAWSGYGALAPEPASLAPVFDAPGTKARAEDYVGRQTKKSWLDAYGKNPKKLASDMLQFSALLVTAEGVRNKDVARILSGITLAASNYMQREMRDVDFGIAEEPGVSR